MALESEVQGNLPASFGKGASEKGRKVPRRCPTSSVVMMVIQRIRHALADKSAVGCDKSAPTVGPRYFVNVHSCGGRGDQLLLRHLGHGTIVMW